MNKLVLVSLLLLSVTQAQAAGQGKATNSSAAGSSSTSGIKHGPAGCGLGALMFQGKDGLVFQVLAATFNGSSANQTFAMSSGTLGCEDAQTAKVAAVSFIQDNKFALANDVARGGGESLDAYLSLIGAQNADRSHLQKNYKAIFSTSASSEEIHQAILALIQA